jgi:hypothetical protein
MVLMLGCREDVEAGFIGERRELSELVEHLLIAFVVSPDRPQTFALLERRGDRWEHEEHEFHQPPPPIILG